jgi:very-short-patch-repair endonuclease
MAWPGWETFDPATHERAVREQGSPARKPSRRRAVSSKLEAALLQQITLCRLPTPERNVRLIEGRLFTWDFVWRAQRVCLEVQGGTWSQGAHSRGAGQARDAKKQALATLAGWRCLAVTTDQIRSGEAIRWIEQALKMLSELRP